MGRGRPPLSEAVKLRRAEARQRAGTALRKLRQRAGLTQAGLAERLDEGRATVWAWEHGGQPPARAYMVCWQVLAGEP